ncbi:MAG: hypothetical protein HQ523_07220 [Lentisphaerae bacterium]|nr:hypothetical protein [Lentisphaerota bacterium]
MPDDRTTITTSAPGSLMISGEHAVLHGRRALVGAVNRRVHVTLTRRPDDGVVIQSALGEREMTRHSMDATPPFSFVGRALAACADRMATGCDVAIEADMPHDVGLGSSAAVTVAMLAALHTWIDGCEPTRDDLAREAAAVIRSVQGVGSGADVAASVFGGIVLCTSGPEVHRRLSWLPDLSLLYVGYKTPTKEVVAKVEAERLKDLARFEALFDRFDEVTESVATALLSEDLTAVGQAVNEGQTVMAELGVSDPALESLVDALRHTPGIYGAKISGSGLGDCVLGIGRLEADSLGPFRHIRAAFSRHGVIIR